MKSPNQVNNLQVDDERQEGVISEGDSPLTPDISEDEFARIVGKRVEDSEAWWNSELGLDEARKNNEKYYLNAQYSEDDLYDFQVPYKNNRIMTAIETLVPMATSQTPQPIVTEANDTDASRQLAHDLQYVLLGLYDDLYLKAKFSMVARHLLTGYRIGVLKYRFDPNIGKIRPDGTRSGMIVVEVVRPQRVVFEQEASDPDNIPLIAEYMTATIEELVHKFPEKKEDIFKQQGIKRGVSSQLTRRVGYVEIWFSYFDKQGNAREGVGWKLGQTVLGLMKNPNWNYDEYEVNEDGRAVSLNYFDMAKKPYILFNHLNLGKYILDDTSLTEQAQSLQDVLNKRGRQIVENADQSASGLVLNAAMIKQEDAAKIIGDPTEKVMVDGDVRSAATRLPYNSLPAYVLQDKFDARNEIDNIFGANAPMRGETTNNQTLGELVLSQRGNLGRLQTLADSIEDGADRLFKALVQMMKVYWDENEQIRYNPTEGKTIFIDWSSAKIEDGVKIRVKAGSVLPKDKISQRNETIQALAILDPLSIAEGLDKDNPKEFAKRLVYYRFFMDRYMAEILGDDGEGGADIQAIGDLQMIMNGQVPVVNDSPGQNYVATIDQFLNSPAFKSLTPDVQGRVTEFAKKTVSSSKKALGEPAEQLPVEEQIAPEEAPELAPENPVEEPVVEEAPVEQPPLEPQRQSLVGRVMGLFKR